MKCRVFSLIFFFFFTTFSFCQVLPDSSQFEAWKNFNDSYLGKWIIRWHEETGTPATIYGYKTEPINFADAEAIARQFLIQYRTIFKMQESLSDLTLLRRLQDNGLTHIDFQQSYKGIPVLGGEYSVAVGSDKAIQMVGGRYFPNVQASTTPTISKQNARNNAAAFLKISPSNIRFSSSQLVIEHTDKDFILAYQLELNEWEVIVDAISGRIVRYVVRTPFTSATGKVYPKDPDNSSLTTVTLPRLNAPEDKLDGQYVIADNDELGQVIESSSNFSYTPPSYTQHDNTHFNDVNVYYHLDKFITKYWESIMGSTISYKVLASVHDPGQLGHDNASADWDALIIFFGHGGPRFYDLAKKDDIIYHEYTHIVSGRIGLGIGTAYSAAMHEGYSDYHAASYTVDPSVGEWVTRNFSDLRTVANLPSQFHNSKFNQVSYTGSNPINTAGSAQANGMIWAGALWDLRNAIGDSTITNFLVYKGLVYKHSYGTDFLDGREGIIIADQNYYGGVHVTTIKNVFQTRGIYNPPPPPGNLVITNAGSVGQSPNLSWYASSGATSYNIYRRVSFSSEWLLIDSSTSTSYTDGTFTILDPNDPNADEFFYHVTAVNNEGESVPSNTASVWGLSFYKTNRGENEVRNIPEKFELEQNYPNPFNPGTKLQYTLTSAGYVELVITNLHGQKVRTLVAQQQPSGWYNIVWDGRNNQGNLVASGVYLYTLVVQPNDVSQKFIQVRKMSLIR